MELEGLSMLKMTKKSGKMTAVQREMRKKQDQAKIDINN